MKYLKQNLYFEKYILKKKYLKKLVKIFLYYFYYLHKLFSRNNNF